MSATLGRLLTDLGERSTYDAASQCSRCGYCGQSCPTYVATGNESRSPRGRVQILRSMLEGKLDDPIAAEEALSTCLLCSACTTTCYAKVPVADLALEGRRLLSGRAHWAVRAASRLLVVAPSVLGLLLKAAFLAKRLGLSRPFRPLLRRVGFSVLAAMDEHVDEAPLRFFDDVVKTRKTESPAWRYFAACGTRYLFPRVGLASVRVLEDVNGAGATLANPCCGLLAHNYGELDDARALARKNIALAEAGAAVPIVGDCSSCVSFLKTYPQLFLRPEDASWRERAERFSARVKDVIEIYGEHEKNVPPAPPAGRVAYHDSCRALNGQNVSAAPRKAAKAAAGERYCELAGAAACCGGAGAFAFAQEELSEELLKKKIAQAAAAHADVVLTSSTSCLIQLARGLRKYYPEARALHLSEYIAGALDNNDGS